MKRHACHLGICRLHFNELPFKHLFQTHDGDTTRPKSFSGPIGRQHVDVKNFPVVTFDSIQCVIPEIDRKVLSKDQQYLFDISTAVKSGKCPENSSIPDPGGPHSHSRWLTTANRVFKIVHKYVRIHLNL